MQLLRLNSGIGAVSHLGAGASLVIFAPVAVQPCVPDLTPSSEPLPVALTPPPLGFYTVSRHPEDPDSVPGDQCVCCFRSLSTCVLCALSALTALSPFSSFSRDKAHSPWKQLQLELPPPLGRFFNLGFLPMTWEFLCYVRVPI